MSWHRSRADGGCARHALQLPRAPRSGARKQRTANLPEPGTGVGAGLARPAPGRRAVLARSLPTQPGLSLCRVLISTRQLKDFPKCVSSTVPSEMEASYTSDTASQFNSCRETFLSTVRREHDPSTGTWTAPGAPSLWHHKGRAGCRWLERQLHYRSWHHHHGCPRAKVPNAQRPQTVDGTPTPGQSGEPRSQLEPPTTWAHGAGVQAGLAAVRGRHPCSSTPGPNMGLWYYSTANPQGEGKPPGLPASPGPATARAADFPGWIITSK